MLKSEPERTRPALATPAVSSTSELKETAIEAAAILVPARTSAGHHILYVRRKPGRANYLTVSFKGSPEFRTTYRILSNVVRFEDRVGNVMVPLDYGTSTILALCELPDDMAWRYIIDQAMASLRQGGGA